MTTQIFSLPEGDLRRAATESKRVRNHNEKWALGFRDPKCTSGYTQIRPVLKSTFHKSIRVEMNRKCADTKAHFSYVVDQVLNDNYSDSSSDSDNVPDHSEAANDPNVFYSFDAPTGPSQGTDILGAALANAVEKFETKETEKVAREYEFVAFEESTSHHGDGYMADDDDFEFISRADL
ncbi:hypothetical protein GX50_07573 [[Emmonsia] crescens]|uniref:Uncharacterized protein n=1 Tax=[Emmonsia] crescens TaxID=73230 RepID=A0A2B7ZA32_9EURO|nr:hypothetical protein GX50_07573 [Emmonsia crescens]